MKCPKCGFVSYPGLPQCKKCGHPFVAAAKKDSSLSSLFGGLASRGRQESPEAALPAISQDPATQADSTPTAPATPALEEGEKSKARAAHVPDAAAGAAPAWREELAGRVENFRRRRARMRGAFDPTTSLDLAFERSGEDHPEVMDREVGGKADEFVRGSGQIDVDIAPPRNGSPDLESAPIQKPVEGLRILSSAAVEAGDLDLEEESDPMEIVLETPPPAPSVQSHPTRPRGAAPIGKRFLAGVADSIALLLGAVLFGIIFWGSGGRISMRPLSLGVTAFVGAFFIFVYFGMFTAFASSTPGLLSMGLEVRGLDGSFPTAGEALWRAFGILVSMAALFLGFIWALVDSEHLTWHDRMSGTFVTQRS